MITTKQIKNALNKEHTLLDGGLSVSGLDRHLIVTNYCQFYKSPTIRVHSDDLNWLGNQMVKIKKISQAIDKDIVIIVSTSGIWIDGLKDVGTYMFGKYIQIYDEYSSNERYVRCD